MPLAPVRNASPRPVKGRRMVWRAAGLAAAVGAGYLFVTSATASHGVDLRASSVSDLATLVSTERKRADALTSQVTTLNGQVAALTHAGGDASTSPIQTGLLAAQDAAGFRPLSGPGVTVSLDDAPKDVIVSATASGAVTVDELIVHQQDIQAVVNALWAGGAQGITVQGQRLTSTTGIKCVGNTVVLHGVPYAPPYVIQAVGDPTQLVGSLTASEYVAAYQTFVQRYKLGWALTTAPSLALPAYNGPATLSYAKSP